MKKILTILTDPKIKKFGDWDILSDKEMIEIHNTTTDKELKEYNETLEKFLNEIEVDYYDLKVAVSYFYLSLYLKENWLTK